LIVVDASALLEALLATGAHAAILERLFVRGESLHAPHVIDVEAAQVIRRFEARGDIAEAPPGRGSGSSGASGGDLTQNARLWRLRRG